MELHFSVDPTLGNVALSVNMFCFWTLREKSGKDRHASRLQKESWFRTENTQIHINQWVALQIVAILR